MKLFSVSCTICFFLLIRQLPAISQTKSISKPTTQTINPFKKGNWSFSNRQTLSAALKSENPLPNSNQSFNVSIDPSYFFINHFAVGIDARYIFSLSKSNGTKSIGNWQWNTDLTLTYGTQITPRINVYARIGAGIGKSKTNIYFNNDSHTFDLSEYYGTIGVPLMIGENGSSFLTPYANYNISKNKFSGTITTDKSINIGLKLESYINPDAMDHKHRKEITAKNYDQGNGFIDFSSRALFHHSVSTPKNGGTQILASTKNTGESLIGGVGYYIINNLAAGINIDLERNKMNNGAEQNTSTWSVQPMVLYHPLHHGSLRNLFAQVGYGFGGQSNGIKSKTTQLNLKAGWNSFLSKHIAFTSKVGWERTTRNDTPPNNSKTSTSGLTVEMGIRAFFKVH